MLRLPGSLNLKTKTDVDRPCRVVARQRSADQPRGPPRTAARARPRRAARPHRRRPGRTTRTGRPARSTSSPSSPRGPTSSCRRAGPTSAATPTGSGGCARATPTSAHSARVLDIEPHVLVVHSDTAGLPSGAGQRLTKGRVFAHLHHGGDVPAATRDLVRAAAAGDPSATRAAAGLPSEVLTAIREQCWVQPYNAAGEAGATPPAQPPLPVRLPILPEEFWQARPAHDHIRRAAHSRLASADLVLHAVLAKIAGMRSHELYLDSGRGKSSLNYFVAAVAPSGIGKTTSAAVVDDLLAPPGYLNVPTVEPPLRRAPFTRS